MRIRFGLAAFFLLLLVPATGRACSIPVFRYALERWRPSPYEVLVYHRGQLGESDRKALKGLDILAQGANLDVADVDLDRNGDKELKVLWEKHGKDKPLPWVIVRFPEADSRTPLAWSGPLDAAKLKSLIDSPCRQQIVRKLFGGASAVFVLLESGDEKADAEAGKMLAAELANLEKGVVLPALTREGPQLRSEVPLGVSFPLLKLSRKAPQEKQFIDLLMGCEADLEKANGPIAFAVFGRGRVLTALHGKDLKASEVEGVVRFLCGACSCQVKELNPGIDMIFQAQWDAFLEIEIAPTPREAKPANVPEKR
jgi:hypothetical protein